MQIGQARFSPNTLTLVFIDGREQRLSASQGALLLMLVNERDRVVSRSSLHAALLCIGVDEPRLDREINALGKVMGKDWPMLFETVGCQGFILHSQPKRGRLRFGSPVGEVPIVAFLGVVSAVVLVLGLVMQAMPASVGLPFETVHTFPLAGGNSVELRRYGQQEAMLQQLESALSECSQRHWEQISVSASSAGDVLHLVIQGGDVTGATNVKLLGLNQASDQKTLEMLREAGICD
ncbi:hypothetical protein [Shewanella sp.]|uniref:hypothetical protein n=1 Tax=Shewanella sp. TaxID=50422 RepID=UPI0035634D24